MDFEFFLDQALTPQNAFSDQNHYWLTLKCAEKQKYIPLNITKTHLYNFDTLKPHFYIVKLGFTGVYIIFLFLLKT